MSTRTSPFTASRRSVVRAGVAGAAGLAAAPLLGSSAGPGRPSRSPAATRQEPQRGGKLVIASTGQPAGLDAHFSNQRTVAMITWQMYEALFTFDVDYETVPMLATGIEVSADGLVNTIALREGVLFHNGETMTAADVVASYNRWAPIASLGLAIAPFLESITEVDPLTVQITLTSPLSALPSMLARQAQGLSIHPKSVIDAAGTDPLGDAGYIGTGPYQFVERQADRFTLLRRFEDYSALDTPASGYAGNKAANVDELEFIPVPDEAARVAGLQAGEYHYLEEIIPDQIEAIGEDPAVNIQILPPRSYGVIIMNTVDGLFADVALRQAVQAAIAVEPSGQATHGEGYFELGPGIMMPQTAWASEVSAELYDQNDPDKCQQLLDAAGYDGTPIRILCTQEDLGDYNAAVVAQQQLEQGGFTVELEVSDEATLDENLEDDARWDMTTNAYVFRPDPVLIAAFASCSADGKWCSTAKVDAVNRLQTGVDFETRFAAFEELQAIWYEEAPAIKLVNNYGVAALSSQVMNLVESTHFELEPEFANCWLEQ